MAFVLGTPVKRNGDGDGGDDDDVGCDIICESPIARDDDGGGDGGGVKDDDAPVRYVPVRSLYDEGGKHALVFATTSESEAYVRKYHQHQQSCSSSYSQSSVSYTAVVCDPFVARRLRAHQAEGARWMYRALHGFDDDDDRRYRGVVLADEMGLGKSLQVLALLWAMLKQGPRGVGSCSRAVLVCPASLIGNWGAEFTKWLGRVRVQAALAEGNADAVDEACDKWCAEPAKSSNSAFDRWPVLVMSYETARRLAPRVKAMKPELLICDEAHRLRNALGSQTMTALRDIDAPMRVLLTGTPIQNNMNEYAAVLDFAQPGVLGPLDEFQRKFAQPIQRQYEKGASAREIAEGRAAAVELNKRTAGKILSRKASTNAAYLPKKTELVVLCRPTETQKIVYETGAKLVKKWTSADTSASSGAAALCAIGILRQAANELDQILQNDSHSHSHERSAADADDLDDDDNDADVDVITKASSGGKSVDELKGVMSKALPAGYRGGVEGSGKFAVLKCMLEALTERVDATERVVIVSGYSASLTTADKICKKLNLATSRLDGTVSVDLRTSIVKDFNAGRGGRVMLLSVVAGGAGLNLVGANRLILMDVSWNPAHDRQAMGRIWRDGQTKPVTIYRLITAGTVEQKVFERQLGKEVLKNTVESGYLGYEGDGFTTKDSLAGIVEFTGDDLTTNVEWGEEQDVDEACPLLKSAVARAATTFKVFVANDGNPVLKPEDVASQLPIQERARPRHLAPKRIAFEDLLANAKRR